MAQVEEDSHSGKSGWASRGGCWWCGQVPKVGLKPVLKEKGPSRQFKWLSVGSDLPVLSKMQEFFSLDPQRPERSSHVPSDSPQSHLYFFLSQPLPQFKLWLQPESRGRQKDSSAGEVGGVRKYSCCVLWGGKG